MLSYRPYQAQGDTLYHMERKAEDSLVALCRASHAGVQAFATAAEDAISSAIAGAKIAYGRAVVASSEETFDKKVWCGPIAQ